MQENRSLGLFLDQDMDLDLNLGLDLDLDLDQDMDLFLDQTEVINQPVDHIWLNCAICVVTIMVNIWAIRVLKTKEDT